MPTISDRITPKNAAEWRAWLEEHHTTHAEIWVVYVKTRHGRTLTWSDAVDEALCFGWIDTTAKKLDDRHYMQRFTPRRPGSRWSTINKKKVERLVGEGRMTKAGLEQVERAKKSGEWKVKRDPTKNAPMPPELDAALSAKARKVYGALAPGYQNLYRRFVGEAKQRTTRLRRAEQCAKWLLAGLTNPWGAGQA
jgi:uncharacterized protein YdeI (YjbR/CyaY-like superfamily)